MQAGFSASPGVALTHFVKSAQLQSLFGLSFSFNSVSEQVKQINTPDSFKEDGEIL